MAAAGTHFEDESFVHPWRALMTDLIEEMTPEIFESTRLYTKGKIEDSLWKETEVEGSYKKLSSPDFLLKKRKFFEGLECFHGEKGMPDVMSILCDHLMYHKSSEKGTESFVKLIEDYKKALDNFEKQVAERGIILNEIFVGREDFIRRVKCDLFTPTDYISGVCICGMYGIGKTSVANHICFEHDRRVMGNQRRPIDQTYKSFRMNLKGVSDLQSLLPKFSIILGNANKFASVEEITAGLSEIKSNTILFMDNADELLKMGRPTEWEQNHKRQRFLDFLSCVTTIENPKVKLLLTSRFKLIDKDEIGDEPVSPRTPRLAGTVIEHELGGFKREELEILLKKLAPKVNFTKEDIDKISADTQNSPYSIQMRASQYKLSKGDVPPDMDPEHPISSTFNSLADRWKSMLLSLSVFDSSFDCEAARAVMKQTGILDTVWDLQYLKSCHLVEVDDMSPFLSDSGDKSVSLSKRENVRYSLHTLTKMFLSDLLKSSPNSEYREQMNESERSFVKHFSDKWRELARISKEDYAQCYLKVQELKGDLEKMLELQCKRVPYTDKKIVHRQAEFSEMYSALDLFVNEYQRVRYFRSQANEAITNGQLLTFCHMKLWEALQHQNRGEHRRVIGIIAKIEMKLDEIDRTQYRQAIEIIEAFVKYVRGVHVSRYENRQLDAVRFLDESLEVYDRVLGNDTFTARILNSVGAVYFTLSNAEDNEQRKLGYMEKSLTYHERAYEMLRILSPAGKHFDMPTYIMNIGTVLHILGKHKQQKSKTYLMANNETAQKLKRESREHFDSAIVYYDKAMAADKKLLLYGYARTSQALKNKATILCELEQFETALDLSLEALDIRRKYLSPIHPDRAKISHFVGTIYIDLGKQQQRRKNTAGAKENWRNAEKHFIDSARSILESTSFPLHDSTIDNLQSDLKYISNVLRKQHVFKKYETEFQRYRESRRKVLQKADPSADDTDSDDSESGKSRSQADLSDSSSVLSSGSEKDEDKSTNEAVVYKRLPIRERRDGVSEPPPGGSSEQSPSSSTVSTAVNTQSTRKRKHSETEGEVGIPNKKSLFDPDSQKGHPNPAYKCCHLQ